MILFLLGCTPLSAQASNMEASDVGSHEGSGELSTETQTEAEAEVESAAEDTGDDQGDFPSFTDMCAGCGGECDPFEADACGDGEQCVPGPSPIAPDEDIFVCRDVLGNAGALEPCTQVSEPPLNDCAKGLVCVEWSPTTEFGWCASLCDDELAPCDMDEQCVPSASGGYSTCRPLCDPLDNDCPQVDSGEPATTCGFGLEPGFVCHGTSTGQAQGGEACVLPTDCDDGLLCLSGAVVGPSICGQHAGCCATLCDTQAPSCEPEQTCVNVFMPGQATDYESLGFCQGA